MRILHVTPYWADAWSYGGIPRVAGALVRHQAEAGHRVTVCTTDACSREERLSSKCEVRRSTFELRVFPNVSNRLAYDFQFFTPRGMHRFLRDHAHEFDVAHLHACRNAPGALAAHYLTRYGVPYVLAPNGTAPLIERRILAKRLFDWLAGTRVLRNAAAVIAVSEAERNQLLAIGVDASRIQVIPNPVDLDEFAAPIERGVFRRRHDLDGRRLVTFLGKITPRKRLDVLVRAFASLPADATLVIAGNDMGGLAGVHTLARSLGVSNRVHLAGALRGRGRLHALADSDVVVYPGEDEVFGLVAAEAILSGTPVVVANDSGCGEIVSRAGGGIVTPVGDAHSVAAAIQTILGDAPAWRSSAAIAAENVRSEFGATDVAARATELYGRLASPVPESRRGVSLVVPIKNGLTTLAQCLESIEGQADGRPTEIIVVDDRSEDGSSEWLAEQARRDRIRLIAGSGRGVSAAVNAGVNAATHPIICQVDQDVALLPGWMTNITAALDADDRLGAVQGQFTVNHAAPVLARVMALDLEQRYERSRNGHTTHVCTGNVAYRREAWRQAEGLDEQLGYGNDVDLSYRLQAAGWKLGHAVRARSFHAWRQSLVGYWRQQYGFGYGRLDLVSKDRRRISGDSVAPLAMMAHPIVMGAALLSLAIAGSLRLAGSDTTAPALIGIALLAVLIGDRSIAGIRALASFGDPAALLFPIVHLMRDAAWVAATCVWLCRRLLRRPSMPSHSMTPRQSTRVRRQPSGERVFIPQPARTIGIIPAHNEAATISAVIADIRARRPDLDLLVVDDGSTDNSVELVARAGARWIELPERMGVGTAMRAGMRYARHMGYDSAIRVDADGQHSAGDIDRLLAPILEGQSDVVLGSRFLVAPPDGPALVRLVQRGLAVCLSIQTRAAVTDPTSGFCAFGPRAMKLLASDHPTGYPEPEMRLLFSRHGLKVVEVPVEARPRLGGRTSLTVIRLGIAAARVLLAMVMVPLRRGGSGGDGA